MKLIFGIFLITAFYCSGMENILKSADFQNGKGGWLLPPSGVTIADSIVRLEKQSKNSESYPWIIQQIKLVPKVKYDLHFDFRAENLGAGGEVRIEFPQAKSGIIKELGIYNTVWNHQKITFDALGEDLNLVFRVWPGEGVDSVMFFRNIVLSLAGETIMPFKIGKIIKNEQKFPYHNLIFTSGDLNAEAINSGELNLSGKGIISIITTDVIPEFDYEFSVLQISETESEMDYSIEMLDYKGNNAAEMICGKLPVKKVFHFASDTVYLKINFYKNSDNMQSVSGISLRKLQYEFSKNR